MIAYLHINHGENRASRGILTTPNIELIIDYIQKGTVIGVSYGSFKDGSGTAYWIKENDTCTQLMMLKVLVSGLIGDQIAYRNEISGIYGMVMVLVLNTMWRKWGG